MSLPGDRVLFLPLGFPAVPPRFGEVQSNESTSSKQAIAESVTCFGGKVFACGVSPMGSQALRAADHIAEHPLWL